MLQENKESLEALISQFEMNFKDLQEYFKIHGEHTANAMGLVVLQVPAQFVDGIQYAEMGQTQMIQFVTIKDEDPMNEFASDVLDKTGQTC